jgi:DeoR/GlpR family transcriptional regulator of sugar metabolism
MQFAPERHAAILDRLERDGRVVSAALAEQLGVSIDSIRRDLQELEAGGALRRVHGGAVPPLAGRPSFLDRLEEDEPAKRALAELAATLVRDGDVVALGGGTTAVHLAQALRPGLHATVLTAGLDVALALRPHPGIAVDVLGGRLDRASQTLTGADTVEAARRVRPDLCLVSPCWFDAHAGVTLREREEAAVVAALVANARRVALVTSADKLGAAGPYVVAAPHAVDVLVTDGDTTAFAGLDLEILRP